MTITKRPPGDEWLTEIQAILNDCMARHSNEGTVLVGPIRFESVTTSESVMTPRHGLSTDESPIASPEFTSGIP